MPILALVQQNFSELLYYNFSILEILACYGWLKETPSIFQVFGTNIN
jgi:hypothetical protein